MDRVELQSLQTRLTALERKATGYRNAFVLLLLALAGVVLVGATTDDVQDVVRTKRLLVLNDDGESVIMAFANTAGNGLFSVFDGDRKFIVTSKGLSIVSNTRGPLISVASTAAGGFFAVHRDTTNPFYAGLDPSGNGLIQLNSNTGKTLFAAGTNADDNGLLKIYSKTGKDLIYAGADAEGHGLLTVSSKTGKGLIFIGGNNSDDGQITIRSSKGKSVIRAIATSDGALMLLSASETAKPAVLIGVDELGTGLVSVGNSKGEYRTLEPGP